MSTYRLTYRSLCCGTETETVVGTETDVRNRIRNDDVMADLLVGVAIDCTDVFADDIAAARRAYFEEDDE